MDERINTGHIKIIKYGQEYKFEDNSLLLRRGEPVADAGFEITAAENINTPAGNIVYKDGDLAAHSLKTDDHGMAITQELPYGKYNIYETDAGEGYKMHDQHILQVDLNQKELLVNVDSDLILGTLKVRNLGQDITSFSIFDQNRTRILTSIVEEGCAISFDEMIPVGAYYYKDIHRNVTKFQITDDTEFVILEAQKSCVDVRVTPKEYESNEFALYKVDDAGKPLMGAVFGLIDIHGTRICFSCSDKDGRVLFKHLKNGTYLVKEIDAPNGYKESEMNIVFTIDDSWVNQSERIDNGERFEDVYIVISDMQYTGHENVFVSEDICSRDPEINCAVEEITNTAEVVFRAALR